MSDTFIAVDWGTSNRRAFRIEDGAVTASERDGRGVTALAGGDYAAEVAGLRARLGDLPVLMAGMVGSTIGWREAAYVAAPAGLEAIAAGLLAIDERTAIVPGVSWRGDTRADVMRGEEMQLLGATAAGLVPADALLVQPGTHCKWVEMTAGRIGRFTTAMTGELFALLRRHSVLARQLEAPVGADAAFLDGVRQGARGDLAASLFGVRAAGLLGQRADRDAASFTSGLLIGNDVAMRLAESDHDTAHLLADNVLGPLYAAAIEANGREARLVDSEAAFVAGTVHLQKVLA
jgi:2-dehydro-3-deoxygalactonokinase